MAKTYDLISELLKDAGKLKTRKEKIEFLQNNNSMPLRTILKGAFDPALEFILPEGEPPYKKDGAPEGLSPSNLFKQMSYFQYFDKGGVGDNMSAAKRERLFIQLLESIHPAEAEIVLLMKDKKLGGVYKGITKKLVSDAFPGLIKGSSKPVEEAAKVNNN